MPLHVANPSPDPDPDPNPNPNPNSNPYPDPNPTPDPNPNPNPNPTPSPNPNPKQVSPSRGAARTVDKLLPMHGQLVQVLAKDRPGCASCGLGSIGGNCPAHARLEPYMHRQSGVATNVDGTTRPQALGQALGQGLGSCSEAFSLTIEYHHPLYRCSMRRARSAAAGSERRFASALKRPLWRRTRLAWPPATCIALARFLVPRSSEVFPFLRLYFSSPYLRTLRFCVLP